MQKIILKFTHRLSTFYTDPFEPQRVGAGTIFPYWIQNGRKPGGYLELPYTLPQDHLLFVILRETSIDIWKKKLDWIAEQGGMALLNTHSDYMNFGQKKSGDEEYSVALYTEFLEYVNRNYKNQFWHVLPREMTNFWKANVENISVACKRI